MKNHTRIFVFTLCIFSLLSLAGCGSDPVVDASECINELTADEKAQGWRLLFDGQSLEHWRSYQEDELDNGWTSENGCLARVSWAGDIISRDQFENFELKLEWKISDSGNSGIFILGDEEGDSIHHTGLEMQVLDNAGHWDGSDPSHRSGAYYDMIEPDHDTTQAVGFWNKVHILSLGDKVEFWLNGRQTAVFELGSPEWEAMYQASKFTDRPRYGSLRKGHIGLQDHWDKVWYRNIRVLEH